MGDYASQLLGNTIVFGVISIVFRSWFPIALGWFFFFTDDRFIEWALGAVGIRLVPDTIGSRAIRAFVFFAGLGALCTKWKDSVPALLVPWMPIDASWLQIAALAVAIAVLAFSAAWLTKHILPRLGIAHPNGAMTLAIEGLLVLTFMALVYAASATFG